MRPRLLVISVFGCLLTRGALAQDFYEFPIETRRLPFQSDGGVASALATGNFDGNHITDAVHLRGDSIVFVHDIGYDGVSVQIPAHAYDLATLRTPGGIDEWLIAMGSGLFRGHWSDAAFAETGIAVDGIILEPIDTLDWCGVTRITTADLNGDGWIDIAGIEPTAHRLRTLLATASGFVAGPWCDTHAAGSSIGSFDRDGDGRDQVVVALPSGAMVYDLLNGTLKPGSCSLPAYPYVKFARYERVDGKQSLAAMTRALPSLGQYVIVDSEAGVDSTLHLLAGVDATSFAAADFELDGRTDLMFNSRADGRFHWAIAGSALPTFDLSEPMMNAFLSPADGLGTADPSRETDCVAVDYDHDFDFDLVFGDDTTGSSSILINPAIDAQALRPRLLYLSSPGFVVSNTNEPELHLTLNVLPPLVDLPQLTHYEVALWRQASPSAPAEPLSIDSDRVAKSGLGVPDEIEIVLPESSPDFTTLYWMRLRMVGVASGIVPTEGQVTSAGPCASSLLDLSIPVKQFIHASAGGGHSGSPIMSGGNIPLPPPGSGTFPNGPPTLRH